MSSMSLTAQQQPQVQASQPPSQMTNEVQQPSLQQQVNGSINGQYDARLTTEPDAIKQEVGGEPTSQQQPGGQQQQHPGVGNAKIKSDEPAKIKRPMNPFMIFGCEKRRKLAQVHPRMHNSEISKILGAEWKRMSDYEKSPYVQEAKRLKEQHSIEYPNYKFKANRRKPRQAIKKEPRAAYPYGSEINSLPAAMKFPYPSPFFQDSMYGTMYPVMPSSHQYSSMYDFARQSMSAGGGGGGALVRSGVAAPTTTAATADYYSLNKTTSPTAGGIDYYGSTLPNKADYYSAGTPGATTRPERTSSAGDVTNLSDRYPTTADSRQFENGRYSASSFATGQTPPGASVPATYSSIQNIPHMDSPATYSSYSTLYEQRH